MQHPHRLIEFDYKLRSLQLNLAILHPCGIEHPTGCAHGGGIVILVGEVDNLLDTRLDNRLCTLVAGEQTNVYGRSCEALSTGIEDSIQLCVYNVLVLGLAKRLVSVPGELIVRTSLRKSVVACGEDSLVTVNDAGTNLSAGIL